jgi:hypothetical protein
LISPYYSTYNIVVTASAVDLFVVTHTDIAINL